LLVVPGGEEASELGRDGERAAPGSGDDGAVAGESAEVGEADVVRAARDHGDGDQRAELRVGSLVGQGDRAGDGGVELAGAGLAEAVLEDTVDGAHVGLGAGALKGVERRADAHVDLGGRVAATGEREDGIGGLLVGPPGVLVEPAGGPLVRLVPGVVDGGAIAAREVVRELGPHAVAGQRVEDVVDRAEVRELQARSEREILAAVGLGDLGRALEQRLQRGGLVRVGFEELRDGRRRAFLVHDQP
jgi:hypothetical protein